MKNRINIVRSAVEFMAEASGERYDAADVDLVSRAIVAHAMSLFGTRHMDADTIVYGATYLAKVANSRVRKLDAGETLIVQAAGMLESKLQPQKVLRPPTKGAQICRVTSDVDPGSNSWSYEMYDHAGMAQLIANYADDIELVSSFSSKFTGDVLTFGLGYAWTWSDMLRTAKTGLPLRNIDAEAVNEGFDRRTDRVAALGHSGTNVTGILNNANITILNAAAAAGGANAPEWDGADKTTAEILADLLAMQTEIQTASKEVHGMDGASLGLVLPQSHYRLLDTTHMYSFGAGVGSNPTILEQFLSDSGMTKDSVTTWWHCATAAADTNERALMYTRTGIAQPELEIPKRPTDLPPQARNAAVVINTLGKIAGVRVRFPLAHVYMDDI